MTERGPRLGKSAWALYLATGAALAVVRVALFAWVTHRAFAERVSDLDGYVWNWAFYPEGFIINYFAPFAFVYYSRTATNMLLGTLIALVSFVIAIPILPLGWLWRRRQQKAGR